MTNNRTVIILGSTNYLGRALVDTFLRENYANNIVVTGRSLDRIKEYYSDKKYHKLKKIMIDVEKNNDLLRLVDNIKKNSCALTVIYLAAVKPKNDEETEKAIQIGFLASVKLHQHLIKQVEKFDYVVVGSQGDVHGTARSSSYNAAKSAMSNYFEPKIFLGNDLQKVFLVKPWIFDGTTHKKILRLKCSADRVANDIYQGLDAGKQLIYIPLFTYKAVQLLSFVSKKLTYFLIFKFMK